MLTVANQQSYEYKKWIKYFSYLNSISTLPTEILPPRTFPAHSLSLEIDFLKSDQKPDEQWLIRNHHKEEQSTCTHGG